MDTDITFLSRAITLAKKSHPSPNPRVGAVIVKDGKIIGEGYHHAAGENHAEIVALDSVSNKKLLEGATLYVTLEPCSHHDKRTPPCTSAIIASGIRHVVIGCLDQNPKVEGVEQLQSKGIGVRVVNDPECIEINEAFFHWIRAKKPFVMLKLAMTLDGRIATKTGDSKYISNRQAHALVHSWRSEYDAVMVGVNTAIVDDAKLTCRKAGGHQPIRIIVDSHLRIPLHARALLPGARRIVACSSHFEESKKKQLESLGVEVLECGDERVDLKQLFELLGAQDITSVMVEGGSEIASALLDEGLINKGNFFIAGTILGAGKSAFEGKGVEKMKDALTLKNISIRKVQDNVLLSGYF